jgi:hypothetical protein
VRLAIADHQAQKQCSHVFVDSLRRAERMLEMLLAALSAHMAADALNSPMGSRTEMTVMSVKAREVTADQKVKPSARVIRGLRYVLQAAEAWSMDEAYDQAPLTPQDRMEFKLALEWLSQQVAARGVRA